MNELVNDNLYETRNNLVKEITFLTDAQFNEKPDLDKWSIAQVCHHLVLAEESFVKAIAWGLKQVDSSQKERKNIHLILDVTRKNKAPEIVEPDVETFEVQQIIDLLNNSREKLMTLLSTIEDKTILAKKSAKHALFGELPLDQWIELIYLHEQRHIKQIKEEKLLLGASS